MPKLETGGTVVESKVLNGKVYYALMLGPNIEFRHLLEENPIWKREIASPMWTRMNLDDDGMPQAKAFTTHSVDVINLQTHTAHATALGGDPQKFADFEHYLESVEPVSRQRTFRLSSFSFIQAEFVGGKWINLNPEPIEFGRDHGSLTAQGIKLRTGRVAMYASEEYNGKGQAAVPNNAGGWDLKKIVTAGETLRSAKFFETKDGRLLLGVISSEWAHRFLQVWDLAQSEVPIMNVKLVNASVDSNFEFFEREGFVYIAASYDESPGKGSLKIFDVFSSNEPIETVATSGFGTLRIEQTSEGQVYAAILQNGTQVYSLFNASEER